MSDKYHEAALQCRELYRRFNVASSIEEYLRAKFPEHEWRSGPVPKPNEGIVVYAYRDGMDRVVFVALDMLNLHDRETFDEFADEAIAYRVIDAPLPAPPPAAPRPRLFKCKTRTSGELRDGVEFTDRRRHMFSDSGVVTGVFDKTSAGEWKDHGARFDEIYDNIVFEDTGAAT